MENITEITQQFLAIPIVGVAFSAAIQWLQNKYGVEGNKTRAIAIAGSVVLGGIVYALSSLPIWLPIVGILMSASTMYAMVFAGKRKQ